MADKKVERSGRERPITPTQKMEASLSDPGTMNMSEAAHDKGKSALVDKYREREERWRREQSQRDLQAQQERETVEHGDTSERPGEEDKLEGILRSDPQVKSAPPNREGGAKGGAL
jgi:hypothetical protein